MVLLCLAIIDLGTGRKDVGEGMMWSESQGGVVSKEQGYVIE